MGAAVVPCSHDRGTAGRQSRLRRRPCSTTTCPPNSEYLPGAKDLVAMVFSTDPPTTGNPRLRLNDYSASSQNWTSQHEGPGTGDRPPGQKLKRGDRRGRRPTASRPGRRRHARPPGPGPGPGSRQPTRDVRRPGPERPGRPVLARAGPSRHRLQPGPPLPCIPASVTPSARESTSHLPVAWPMLRRQHV